MENVSFYEANLYCLLEVTNPSDEESADVTVVPSLYVFSLYTCIGNII